MNVVRGNTVVHDEALAQELVAFLRREGLADPVPGTAAIEIPVAWEANQARMAQRSANAFAASVKKASIKTDYALLVEILCNANESRILGVHLYWSDSAGLLAAGRLTNSHWEEFQQVRPKDRRGGYEVSILMLRKLFMSGSPGISRRIRRWPAFVVPSRGQRGHQAPGHRAA